MGLVFGMLLCWLFFTCLVGTTSLLLRVDYLACLVPTLIVATLVMCAGQALFASFTPPFLLLVAWAVAFPVLLVVLLVRHDARAAGVMPGVLVFLALCALMSYIDVGRHFISWDEFSHWGVMVKEMLRLDQFYADPASTLMVHKDYPPFASVYELIWCKVAGGYSETVVTLALNVLLLSLVVPSFVSALRPSGRTNGLAWFCRALLLGLGAIVPLVVFNDTSNSLTIFTDALVSYLFVYSAVLVLTREATGSALGRVSFVLAQVALILTKQVSIAFVCLDVLLLLLVALLDARGEGVRLLVAPLAVAVVSLLACAVANRLWAGYVSALGIEGQFDLASVSASAYVAALRGSGDALQASTIRAFLKALLSQQLFTGSVFTITYASAFLLALAMLLLARFVEPRGVFRPGELPAVALTLLVGVVGYAFMMSVLYLFSFDAVEMSELASFNRYMDTYVVGELTIACYLLVVALQHRFGAPSTRLMGACVLAAVAILMPANLENLVPQVLRGNSAAAYQQAGEYLEQKAEPGSHAMIMANNITQYKYYVHYFSSDIWMENDTSAYTNGYQYLTDPYEGESLQALLDTVSAHDYVYVIDFNDALNAALGSHTAAGSLAENTVYKVEGTGTSLVLVAE